MGLISQIEQRAASSTAGISSEEAAILLGGYPTTSAGVPVNAKSVQGITAYYCSIKVISESIAQLPLSLYRRNDKSREKIYSPIWQTVAEQPNTEQVASEFWEYMISMACRAGVAYAEIDVDERTGRVQLWPLPMNTVERKTVDGRVIYQFWNPVNGEQVLFAPWQILKISGFAINGLTGLNLIDAFRTTLGISLATQQYGADFFGRGQQPLVVLKTKEALKEQAKVNIETSWTEKYSGMNPKSRVAVLQHGLEVQTLSLTNEQAQFLESRQFQISEYARMLRIPPHMLMDMSQAKWANVEQHATEFVVYTLGPWLRRIEQRLKMQLLSVAESADHYWKFNVNALMRGDTATRGEWYTKMLNNGTFNNDEVREFEDMDPQPDGIGQTFRRPLNTGYAGGGTKEPATDAA